MILYPDTSVLVSLFFAEPRSAIVAEHLAGASEPILVSDLTVGEFGAALSTAVRSRRMSEQAARSILEDFDHWTAQVGRQKQINDDDLKRGIAFVRRFDLGLLFPDALHVAICDRAGATLMTADRRQAEAAASLGVPVIRLA